MNNAHLSLFSGIGGLDLAAEWAGFKTVAFVERDPYCQRVLAKRWPRAIVFDDIRGLTADSLRHRLTARDWRESIPDIYGNDTSHATRWKVVESRVDSRVGLISGGFPCQPHSVAGKRQASADDRDLWPEFARVIREIRPRWVVAENVPGLLHSESGRFFGSVLGDLADMGYSAGWGVWGAADVGALHRRERVFIVAYRSSEGLEGIKRAQYERRGMRSADRHEDVADARCAGLQGGGNERGAPADTTTGQPLQRGESDGRIGESESRVGGMADGFSSWLDEPDIPRVAIGIKDRVGRLRALGNAVVPQQAYPLFKAIAEVEGIVP